MFPVDGWKGIAYCSCVYLMKLVPHGVKNLVSDPLSGRQCSTLRLATNNVLENQCTA